MRRSDWPRPLTSLISSVVQLAVQPSGGAHTAFCPACFCRPAATRSRTEEAEQFLPSQPIKSLHHPSILHCVMSLPVCGTRAAATDPPSFFWLSSDPPTRIPISRKPKRVHSKESTDPDFSRRRPLRHLVVWRCSRQPADLGVHVPHRKCCCLCLCDFENVASLATRPLAKTPTVKKNL